jgi:phosphomannomutase/phosphomannomutase/phosphoglucomutase
VALCDALSNGLQDGGTDVFDIGLCGTEEIYFATFAEEMDGGIMVTASHNPMDYNGMKLVRQGSRPISGDSGLDAIRGLAQDNQFAPPVQRGSRTVLDTRPRYIEHLLGYIDRQQLRPLKVVVNAGNGCAGPVLDQLEQHLPFEFIKVHHEPDGSFPNGIPNPLLPENRSATAEAVVAHGADLGIAWDGDFDRCFLFDEQGSFIEGYYVVGLLAAAFLQHHPGARIIHDPRLTWNTMDLVSELGGTAVMSKTGHAFIKERMRQEDAVYGGEMSAHHYFRDFAYCDSGMIPWLLVTELMSSSGQPLSSLVGERIKCYPASGEINRRLSDPAATLSHIENQYRSAAKTIDFTDGLSMEFDLWRFNLRCSNTEPVVRLNVETRGDQGLMEQMTQEILGMMDG